MNEELRKQILSQIEMNARIDLKTIATTCNVAEEDVANEMAAMEKEKIICGYLTLINWDNTSREVVTALIEVKVKPQMTSGFEAIAKQISVFPEVNSVYLMSGGYDFMVLIEGRTMREVSAFVFDKLSTLESIVSTATHFVLKKYKDHGVDLIKEKKDKRQWVGA